MWLNGKRADRFYLKYFKIAGAECAITENEARSTDSVLPHLRVRTPASEDTHSGEEGSVMEVLETHAVRSTGAHASMARTTSRSSPHTVTREQEAAPQVKKRQAATGSAVPAGTKRPPAPSRKMKS